MGERVQVGVSMAKASWYRVGGPAAAWVDVDSVEALRLVAAALTGEDVDLLVVGEGSNLLVSDAGYDGLVVHLDRNGPLGDIDVDAVTDEVCVTAGGAVRMPDLARRCAETGHAGLSWMAGIPGSVGGAVRMNAGVSTDAVEVRHALRWADVFDVATGTLERREPDWFDFGYRRSRLSRTQVVTAAGFATSVGDPGEIAADNTVHLNHRRDSQETRRTGGSVWTNPAKGSAWRLVEEAGAQGLRVGTAQVSNKHANFIVADSGGSADDVRELMAVVRRMVHHHSGVVLEAETVMIGFEPFEDLE